MKKYFGKFVPKKSWIDANGDGDVDYQDFIFAAKSALNSITPSKQTLDINGDGKVDINDALDAARITGAAIAATGITVAVSSYAGAVLVTGQATTIATTITASIGAGIGGGPHCTTWVHDNCCMGCLANKFGSLDNSR
jgi:alkaline phosphatase